MFLRAHHDQRPDRRGDFEGPSVLGDERARKVDYVFDERKRRTLLWPIKRFPSNPGWQVDFIKCFLGCARAESRHVPSLA